MKKFFGLGKGLGSLIPASRTVKPESQKENVFYVEVNKIKPNSEQPRHDFDEKGIEELAKSIKKYGVLQPLLVSKVETETLRGLDVSYSLIAGERRWRASKIAGLPHVPVIIRDDFEEKKVRLEVALIENLQRKDLNPVEEAEAFVHLTKDYGLTQQEIAEKVSKSREVITNSIRLLNLPKDMLEAARSGKISRAHARALLAFNDEKKQREIYAQILAGGLTSRAIEGIASAIKSTKPSVKKENKFIELEKNLGETLAAPVLIKAASGSGRIIIKFASLEELNKIAKSIID